MIVACRCVRVGGSRFSRAATEKLVSAIVRSFLAW
jgi:hypothetical protein